MSSPFCDGDHVTLQALCDALKVTIRIVKPTGFRVGESDIGTDCGSPMGSGGKGGKKVRTLKARSGGLFNTRASSPLTQFYPHTQLSQQQQKQKPSTPHPPTFLTSSPLPPHLYITQEMKPRRLLRVDARILHVQKILCGRLVWLSHIGESHFRYLRPVDYDEGGGGGGGGGGGEGKGGGGNESEIKKAKRVRSNRLRRLVGVCCVTDGYKAESELANSLSEEGGDSSNSAFCSPETPNDCCGICLDDLPTSSSSPSSACPNMCSHTFHQKCLLQWAKVATVCPLCKQEFTGIKCGDGRIVDVTGKGLQSSLGNENSYSDESDVEEWGEGTERPPPRPRNPPQVTGSRVEGSENVLPFRSRVVGSGNRAARNHSASSSDDDDDDRMNDDRSENEREEGEIPDEVRKLLDPYYVRPKSKKLVGKSEGEKKKPPSKSSSKKKKKPPVKKAAGGRKKKGAAAAIDLTGSSSSDSDSSSTSDTPAPQTPIQSPLKLSALNSSTSSSSLTESFINRMVEAASQDDKRVQDLNAAKGKAKKGKGRGGKKGNSQQQPTEMKNLLPSVKLTVFSSPHSPLLHSPRFLRVLRQWLSPSSGGYVPPPSVRKTVYEILPIINVTREGLRESDGLPKLLLWYYQNENETEGNRGIVGEVLREWSKLSRKEGGGGGGGGKEEEDNGNGNSAAGGSSAGKKKRKSGGNNGNSNNGNSSRKKKTKQHSTELQDLMSRGYGKRAIRPVKQLNIDSDKQSSLKY